MAKVKDVTLQISSGSADDKRKVTVAYKLVFTAGEVGKKYQVVIGLVGEDKPGDDEPAPFFAIAQPFYTFGFGLFHTKFTTITAQAGEQSFAESRELDRATLNEDPGVLTKVVAPGSVIQIPHPDEVYARVSVASESRSPTVTLIV